MQFNGSFYGDITFGYQWDLMELGFKGFLSWIYDGIFPGIDMKGEWNMIQ